MNMFYRKSGNRTGLFRCCLLILLGLISGCTGLSKTEEQAPVFYPPLPNPPRIQHLASFSKLRDVVFANSAFADFVLGDRKTESDLITKPYGVSMHDGKIYVVDTRGNGYGVLDIANKSFNLVRGSGAGKFTKPINITIDADGTKYLTDTGRKQVLVYDRNDKYVTAFGIEGDFKPSDVAISGNHLYVSDLARHQIVVLDKASGAIIRRFGKVGSKEGELFFPTNLAMSPDKKNIYISDTGNFRIQVFSTKGKYIRTFGSVGTGIGKFARPKGIAVDRSGNMYVVDAAFENLQMFNESGKLLMFFGGPGGAPENINLPTDVHIEYDNVSLFQQYAAPGFTLEYVILVASQFGGNKINIFGFGKMKDVNYESTDSKDQ